MENNNDKVPILNVEQFMEFFLNNNFDENMFTSDGHINPKYNSSKNSGIISKIFEDNWDLFYKQNKDLVGF